MHYNDACIYNETAVNLSSYKVHTLLYIYIYKIKY